MEDIVRKALHERRGRGELLAAMTAGLLIVATLAAVGSSAQAATRSTHNTSRACAAQLSLPGHVGRIGGITRAVATRAAGCVHNTGDPAGGTPPLIFHGGPVMDTSSTGPLVVRPIFWGPKHHPIDSTYKQIINQYLGDVAAASGQHTNVYSTAAEYFGNNGNIRYNVKVRPGINDTHALPAAGCTVDAADTANIYADGSGYNTCIDDDQLIAETERVVTNWNLPRDYAHIYVMFLPKHVESCFFPGGTTTSANACTINHQPSAAYCAYHSQAPSGMVYANLAFPIYNSATRFTCSSDAVFPVVQTPNGNADADTEVSPTSHEIMEAITDPDVSTGWYDSSGFENGDECAYVFGVTQGSAGAFYNQVINGHHYLTQEEFSNLDFASTGGGCLQGE
jgi:hypothetical protein